MAGSKKRRKKLEKERAARLARELEERDNLAGYTAEDLEGLKVAHELDEVAGDSEQVLVLKDATIDEYEEEGDELENVDLKESERLAEKLELKKKKAVYNPMDDAFDGDSNLLKQYDETISGKKRKYFTLDGQGRKAEAEDSMESSSRGRSMGSLSVLTLSKTRHLFQTIRQHWSLSSRSPRREQRLGRNLSMKTIFSPSLSTRRPTAMPCRSTTALEPRASRGLQI